MKGDMSKIKQIDIRGQICPSTLLVSLKEINNNKLELKRGEIEIHILTDNRDAVTTIPNATKSMGYACAVEKSEEGYYRVIIKSPSSVINR